ncbi:4-hydroxy-3-methylbut-2-en-1-yl diphosphate synthase (ferredoxin) [Candidatus Rhabdochlamydia oedothoracis]|uniref:4-hydroxy-3-methylbut-2-en-1-yl diphosphate synthase (flavodoxin) n=1 Tax=Candidatus Rhabdochlamydia oedothoracis TaxID=2720720 RepID=A0ABX8V4E4_9BACT|nr:MULTISPECIES: (E)-4-hydroxy-3-methylbut-2-enyl-diphosphate synthase [Rhabdochlamydia]KAG6558684.1 4-hydroxy-3-methylbut-2-en-1-yl diphosphate synthase (ferredoxin) [Candidatus Rhabdochlamydia sp. W815]QYF49372.1 4-hydroxy-3-methylbut-2-en-1-yl diphosphate synthase (ferredoxin) [Candidatus Rhabdochlamydia oedothoracis]
MIKYCESTYKTKRWKTREVMVGKVGVGGNNPIRIQSMTTSSTRDVQATIDQIIRLADAGCEIARVTVQGMKEADACEGIKSGLLQRGYTIPLVADIHFFPPAAMRVVDFVDKVRVNPGNYVDRRASFKTREYDDASYAKEIEKIEEKFTSLVEKCKSLKRAMRIGTNHGSLSDRIMNRYGDTPQGMVESALEFARVCRKNDFHDFMFSMKSSNPQVMILAYRLLVAEMMSLGWDYPLHLGVTEAGEGEDGRVKSAMGIGSLLLDGIGNTIRISLTEDPWHEIDPCQRLVALASTYEKKQGMPPFEEIYRNIEKIERRTVNLPRNISLHRDGTVFISVNKSDVEDCDFYKKLGCDIQLSLPKLKRTSADCIVLDKDVNFNTPILKHLQEMGMSVFSYNPIEGGVKLISLSELDKLAPAPSLLAVIIKNESSTEWEKLLKTQPALIVLAPEDHRLHYCRQFFYWLQMQKLHLPVILHFNYSCIQEDFIIQSSAELGALLCDGLGDGIWLKGPYDFDFLRNLSFTILQSTRMRSFKTDFISCPSCGRTLFDLQDVSKRIRARTSHLPGVKIAIMGCIVNGPGEMADADFGYVGSKPGKIDLYLGKTCVEKDIDFTHADNRLIELIKKHGQWIEPEIVEEFT